MQLLSLRRRGGGGYGQISTTVTPLPISPMKNLIVLFKVIIEIVKINSTKRQALEIIPFLRLTSEPFKKLHKCDRVLKTRPCNAMSNGIGKDMHFDVISKMHIMWTCLWGKRCYTGYQKHHFWFWNQRHFYWMCSFARCIVHIIQTPNL